MIDAKGMIVTPGFVDCHNHAVGNSLLYDVLVGNPFEVEFTNRLPFGHNTGRP